MKKKRHPTEEIIRILRKADEGQTVEEVCREVNISVTEARVVIEEWRSLYNRVHPHSGLSFQSPDDFARTMPQPEPVPAAGEGAARSA